MMKAVRLALVAVWKAANRICARRLMPFLPDFVAALERFGHLSLNEEVREHLLAMSPATADRLLYHERHPAGSTISTTRRGKLLKHQIPVRTFFDWNDLAPGFVEADLVAHCGESAEGAYLNTLTLTDIATGWTECMALIRRSESDVSAAIHAVRQRLPFPLLGLDTDNGGEFINYDLFRYCEREKITFTRSRAYRKNDQAHVEEKNGSVVRRLVGYDRYEGIEAWRSLTALYGVLRLYVNFFQPSAKLLSKERKEGRTTKRYDKAQTPYQRILSSTAVGEDGKTQLRASYERLDPAVILRELEHLQDRFWEHAHKKESPTKDIRFACALIAQNPNPPNLVAYTAGDLAVKQPQRPGKQSERIAGPGSRARHARGVRAQIPLPMSGEKYNCSLKSIQVVAPRNCFWISNSAIPESIRTANCERSKGASNSGVGISCTRANHSRQP